MRALSLTQPWASLVAYGEKKIETRSWKGNFTGEIAIHASKGFPKAAKEFALENLFARRALCENFIESPDQLPLGVILGTVEIFGHLTTEILTSNSYLYQPMLKHHGIDELTEKEKNFGDYSENRYGWILKNPKALKTPIPCKGALSLWQVPVEIEQQILTQL